MDIRSKSKFRGAMMGALVGDCLGAQFEFSEYKEENRKNIQQHFDDLENPNHKDYNDQKKFYTDDTAMMKNVAKALILKQPVDYTTMAKLFAEEHYHESLRGYGNHVPKVFRCMRNTKYENVFEPASKQFDGQGSYGNGGAMRIAPIALYYNDYEEMINVAKKSTQLTHTHDLGVSGALLQCIAIREALNWTGDFHAEIYIDRIIYKLSDFDRNAGPFVRKLEQIKWHLVKNLNADLFVKNEEIISTLGTNQTALESVPTAIYCFAQAHKGFPEMHTGNVFRRAIQYAILLGGDTDTIAAMAGAIAGAYFGETIISEHLIKHCEFKEEILQLADLLHNSAMRNE